jgi:ribosomal-protein-alanine N-acetyltransferase
MLPKTNDYHLLALGYDALADVDRIMQRAFDPRYGEAWSKAQCLALLALPGYRLSGLVSGKGKMLGFSISRYVAGESELLLIAVDPLFGRNGYGTILINDWIAHCRQNGINRMFLEVRADNPALTLYDKLGFTRLAVRPAYYRGGDGVMRDAVTMQKLIFAIESTT